MNIFADVKAGLNLIDAVQYYGVQLNRGDFANCLYHPDNTPSMKMYIDHFHCYGCGKHGDIISLTEQLFCISPYEAARKLAQDFHISYNENYVPASKLKLVRNSFSERENKTFRILNEYCNFLEECRERYKPKNPSDELHPLFVESLVNYEKYNYYRDIFITGSKEERLQFIKEFKGGLNL